MDADVNFHDIALLQYCFIASIRAIVCGNMVKIEARGEAHARLDGITFREAIVTDQSTDTVFDAIGDLGQRLARLDVALGPLTNLSVGFGSVTVINEEIRIEVVQVTLFLVRRSKAVLIEVLNFLALGIDLVGEEVGDQNAWGVSLGCGSLLLLLGLSLLVLLFLGSLGRSVGCLSIRIIIGFVPRVFRRVTTWRTAVGWLLASVTDCIFILDSVLD